MEGNYTNLIRKNRQCHQNFQQTSNPCTTTSREPKKLNQVSQTTTQQSALVARKNSPLPKSIEQQATVPNALKPQK